MVQATPAIVEMDPVVVERADAMFADYQHLLHKRIDRMFAVLMSVQWIAAILAALGLSPRTWSGPASQVHIHVWAALLLGGALTIYPIFMVWARPGQQATRHVIAAAQLLMSALLIHLTGGRIETHFHVFGSLAFLAFYRDWRVLVTATLVTAIDHVTRGYFAPLSVYGVRADAGWRWMEHASWVIFEDVFLLISCRTGLLELHTICTRDATLEASNVELESKVQLRTASLSDANVRLEALVTTDPLTGLPNHRALVDVIDKELERSRRYERPCTLLFLDVDHFKALNDGRGHAAGDSALEELGKVGTQVLRGIDTLGRWGGEEFVALLPETDAVTGLEIAERFRVSIAAHLFQCGGGIHLTCSLGIATFPDDATTRSDLVTAADRAMYAAKRMGRNQVRAVTDPVVDTMAVGNMSSREEVAMQGTVEALASLVEARDAYTGEHTEGVARLAVRIAQKMGMDSAEVRLVELVGKLHDIGKVAIPDQILQKPGKLTEEEWILMRRHPEIGADVVSRVPSLRIAAPGIRSHHERWDGCGYPDGLAGRAIPLIARVVTAADVYSAITTTRVYRDAQPHHDALAELRRCAGSQFDPEVVIALDQLFGEVAGQEPLARAA